MLDKKNRKSEARRLMLCYKKWVGVGHKGRAAKDTKSLALYHWKDIQTLARHC